MFRVNDDKSIYTTRGDIGSFNVAAKDGKVPYVFQAGEVVQFKVFEKNNVESVVLQKNFPVEEATESVGVWLTGEETKIGEAISKPVEYWYEVVLNPVTAPQTIVGYDDDGAKIFMLFPEGGDLH